MARLQTDPPLKPLEEMLAEANAEAVKPSPFPHKPLSDDELDSLATLPHGELISLIKRLQMATGMVATLLMTREQQAEAIIDRLVHAALTIDDAKEAREAGKQALDRIRGRVPETINQTNLNVDAAAVLGIPATQLASMFRKSAERLDRANASNGVPALAPPNQLIE